MSAFRATTILIKGPRAVTESPVGASRRKAARAPGEMAGWPFPIELVSMPLFEMTDDALVPRDTTSFERLRLRERQDLQRVLRDNIAVIDPDLLVVAEEFGAWEDANRRIDLLAVDSSGRLVVIELKRTGDAGMADLQALRYAGMVSAMTFDDVERAFQEYLTARGQDPNAARAELVSHIAVDAASDEELLTTDVRIVLVSGGFGRELTTAVLWLNSFEGMDIRCVQIEPYLVGDRVLLDVQQTIPLPEAQDFQVRLRRKKAQQERAARQDGRDFTRYRVIVDGEPSAPLNKRHSVLAMVQALAGRGADPADMVDIVGSRRLHDLDGELRDPEQVLAAFIEKFPAGTPRRYFVDSPIIFGGRTWVLSKMWGRDTPEALAALAGRFSDLGVSWREAEDE